MFSFHGDTVLDPFSGTGTTMLAAMKWRRNSIGVEIDPYYCEAAANRLHAENTDLFSKATVTVADPALETTRIVGHERNSCSLPDAAQIAASESEALQT
jgi:site-specific DNA-methyltransferase (adenine-specific)